MWRNDSLEFKKQNCVKENFLQMPQIFQSNKCLGNKLVALDKCPGIRPFGVGDVAYRLCAKIMIEITGDDVQSECLADQICSGMKAGFEGSIHSF